MNKIAMLTPFSLASLDIILARDKHYSCSPKGILSQIYIIQTYVESIVYMKYG